jgi:hypothetical protein
MPHNEPGHYGELTVFAKPPHCPNFNEEHQLAMGAAHVQLIVMWLLRFFTLWQLLFLVIVINIYFTTFSSMLTINKLLYIVAIIVFFNFCSTMRHPKKRHLRKEEGTISQDKNGLKSGWKNDNGRTKSSQTTLVGKAQCLTKYSVWSF